MFGFSFDSNSFYLRCKIHLRWECSNMLTMTTRLRRFNTVFCICCWVEIHNGQRFVYYCMLRNSYLRLSFCFNDNNYELELKIYVADIKFAERFRNYCVCYQLKWIVSAVLWDEWSDYFGFFVFFFLILANAQKEWLLHFGHWPWFSDDFWSAMWILDFDDVSKLTELSLEWNKKYCKHKYTVEKFWSALNVCIDKKQNAEIHWNS